MGIFCEALVWDEAYVHCSQVQEAQRADIGWSHNFNLEAAGGKEEEDELRQLRASVEELREKGKGVGGQPAKEKKRGRSPGTSGDEDKKKKKKKKRKRESLKIQGKKGLDSLFASTGLDPKPEIRRKVKRRARKVARRSRNKKRGSSTSDTESSSSSSRESAGVEDKDLFEPATPTQRVWKLCPGALTMAMIAEAKEALLTQMGTASEPMEGAVPALVTQYVRQILMPAVSGPVARESHHWGLLLDRLVERPNGRCRRSSRPETQSPGRAFEGHETRTASATRTSCPGKAVTHQYDGNHEGWPAGQRRSEGVTKSKHPRHLREGEGPMEGLEREVRPRREERQGRQGEKRKERGQEEGNVAGRVVRGEAGSPTDGGDYGGYVGELLGGRAAPRVSKQ